jgi:hypothetical protein
MPQIGRSCSALGNSGLTRNARILGEMRFSALLVIAALCVTPTCFAQDAAEKAPPDAVLVTLSPPIYPAIARTAHISGDVVLKIGVRKDGTVASSEFVSGPQLLQRAAIASATSSTFECRNCLDEVTFYSLVYSFQLVAGGCPSPGGQSTEPGKGVTQSGNRITVADYVMPTCDPVGDVVRVRSAKCLYLWKCSVRYAL